MLQKHISGLLATDCDASLRPYSGWQCKWCCSLVDAEDQYEDAEDMCPVCLTLVDATENDGGALRLEEEASSCPADVESGLSVTTESGS